MLTHKRLATFLFAAIALAGIAAGATASTIRYAGPVEVRVKENLSGTDYYTTGRYATIGAALTAITDASDTKPYVIFLPPGVYAGQITMKPNVDIVGSGQGNTTITCDCGSDDSPTTNTSSATLVGASNAELRDLTVENAATSGNYATGILDDGTSPTIRSVTVEVSGGFQYNYGVYSWNAGSPTIQDVIVNVTEASVTESVGVSNFDNSASMTGVSITVTGGNFAYGVLNSNSTPTMTDVTASVTGTNFASHGVRNVAAAPTMTNVTATTASATNSYGLYNFSTAQTYEVTNSRFAGATSSVTTTSAYDVTFTNTVLDGPLDNSTGTWSCVNSSDGFSNLRDADCIVRTLRVAPNGAYASIGAALTAIGTDLPAASSSLRYTVLVGPGTYTGQVTMEEYVDVVGSGEDLTTITCACGNASDDGASATVVGANNTRLSDLTVNNTGGSDYAVGIYNASASPAITNVTVSASGSASGNSGVFNTSASSPLMENMSITASGGTDTYGVRNDSSSAPTISGNDITATGGTSARGVYNDASSPALNDTFISASSGSTISAGVQNSNSSPTLTDVTIEASGANVTYGLFQFASSATLTGVSIAATGSGTVRGISISNDGSGTSYTITARNSSLTGATNAVGNFDADYTLNFGATHLGGSLTGTATGIWHCAESWDASYAPLDTDCVGAGSLLPPGDGGAGGSPPEPPALPAPGE